jgi:hypothetical protein
MSGSDFWKAFSTPFFLMVFFVVAFFAVYKITYKVATAPSIDMISSNEIVTDQSEVPVTGVVHNTKKLVVGGKEVAVANDGGFNTTVPVSVGVNTVEIAAGDKTVTKSTVKITREDTQKAVAAAVTTPAKSNSSSLATSGPVETASGSFGLAAIITALWFYRRSILYKTLQKA